MSIDTVTNFIEPTKGLMAWVKTQLDTYASWTVNIFNGTNYDNLFNYIESLRDMPSAIIVFTGSQYGDLPRRTATFSILVIAEEYRNKEDGIDSAQDLLDKAISLLDHELLNQALTRAKFDRPINLEGTGLNVYEVGFMIEDH